MSKIKDSELVKRGGIEIITAEHFKHFQERLKERHNLDISWEEYQELIDPANNRFKGLIKGLGNNSYGTIEFKGKTLWSYICNSFNIKIIINNNSKLVDCILTNYNTDYIIIKRIRYVQFLILLLITVCR